MVPNAVLVTLSVLLALAVTLMISGALKAWPNAACLDHNSVAACADWLSDIDTGR